MDACKRAERALCVYGEIKRTKTAGGEQTEAFMRRVTAALGELSTDELLTVQCLYIRQLTQEEAAADRGFIPDFREGCKNLLK